MKHLFKFTFLFLALTSGALLGQEDSDSETAANAKSGKTFKMGLFIGSYFANNASASAYNGYGYDLNAEPHTSFQSSYMYQKIIQQYGGGYGQIDQIAQALNVNSTTDWIFNEEDMPTNMHYNPAFIIGLQSRYSVDKKNAIVFNINMCKLTASGNFTISTRPPSGSTQMNNSIQTFGIEGREQRLMIQLGYNRILSENEKVNFFAEGGLNVTYTQFNKNDIYINNLHIDLLEVYDYQGVQAGYTQLPRGVGYGVYGGLGLDVALSEKYAVQLIYSPSLEGIKIGNNSALKFQNSLGVRMYYDF